MASSDVFGSTIARKQRQKFASISLDLATLKNQSIPIDRGTTSSILNPTRLTAALAEYLKSNAAAMALIKNIHDNDSSYEWKFQRFLGSGSFGAAAMYLQEDKQREPVDVVTIKAACGSQGDGSDEQDNGAWPHITLEAAVMSQTNDLSELRHNSNFLYLREYVRGIAMPGKWPLLQDAYYLEYGFFGDLQQLQQQYRAWQRYIPEYFLWHLFHSFAELCDIMEHGQLRWLGRNRPEIDGHLYNFGDILPGAFLNHGEIKPSNIFLTSSAADRPRKPGKPDLPSLRLGDFGCARVLHREEDNSRRKDLFRGTLEYFPPELRTNNLRQLWRSKWYKGAGDLVGNILGRRRLTAAANFWAFGAIMWELMTMRNIGELDKAYG